MKKSHKEHYEQLYRHFGKRPKDTRTVSCGSCTGCSGYKKNLEQNTNERVLYSQRAESKDLPD